MEFILSILFAALIVALWIPLIRHTSGPPRPSSCEREFSDLATPPLALAPLHPAVDEVSLRKSANPEAS